MNLITSIVAGSKPSSETTKQLTNPHNGESLGTLEILSSLEEETFNLLSQMPIRNDKKLFLSSLVKTRELIASRYEEIALCAARETGSPVVYHREDLDAALAYLDDFEKTQSFGSQDFKFEPKGRCLIILSSNQPIPLLVFSVMTALSYGNKVTIKPSTRAPLTASLLVSIMHEAGIQKMSLNIAILSNDLMKELVLKKCFDVVLSFASSEVNKIISSYCIESGTEVHTENEGYDWVYIDEHQTINLDTIADQLVSSVVKHNGQMCDSLRGIFVHKNLYLELKDLLVKKMKLVVAGNPLDEQVQLGSLLSGTDIVAKSYCENFHKDSTKLVEHSILSLFEIDHKKEQVPLVPPFAPTIWISSADSYNDVILLWNNLNPYGLGFTVYSSQESVKKSFLEDIRVARLTINKEPTKINHLDPWGGIKRSGIGGPTYWFERFTNRKFVNL